METENHSQSPKYLITPKLNAALAKAQGTVEHAIKSSENEFFSKGNKKSMFADIAEVIAVIQKPASENGLSVTFNYKTTFANKALDWIQYNLRHDSGECEVSEWVLMRARGDSLHDFGAVNTYYRRQLLKGIFQVPEEDDDGNSQSGADPKKEGTPPAQGKPKNFAPDAATAKKQANAPQKTIPEVSEDVPQTMPDYYNTPETALDQLVAFVKENKINSDLVKDVIKQLTGKPKKSSELTEKETLAVYKELQLLVTK